MGARHRRRRVLLRRCGHHAGHLRALSGRGPEARLARVRELGAAARHRHPDRAVRRAVARHGEGAPSSSVRSPSSGSSPCSSAASSTSSTTRTCWSRSTRCYGVSVPLQARLDRPHRARSRLPGRDRCRGALRRSRPLRPQARSRSRGSASCCRRWCSTTSARARWCSPDPEAIENPFYRLYPEWALCRWCILATAATVIASQAVITGAFSLTRQAIQLGPAAAPRHHAHVRERWPARSTCRASTGCCSSACCSWCCCSDLEQSRRRLRRRRHRDDGDHVD